MGERGADGREVNGFRLVRGPSAVGKGGAAEGNGYTAASGRPELVTLPLACLLARGDIVLLDYGDLRALGQQLAMGADLRSARGWMQ